MLVLLLVAQLFSPFEFKTPRGFVVQYNGAKISLQAIDDSYDKVAEVWKDKIDPAFIPLFTRITVLPMTVLGDCPKTMKFAVVDNGDWRGYTIVVSGGISADELSSVLETAFGWEYQILQGKQKSAAWTDKGCLE